MDPSMPLGTPMPSSGAGPAAMQAQRAAPPYFYDSQAAAATPLGQQGVNHAQQPLGHQHQSQLGALLPPVESHHQDSHDNGPGGPTGMVGLPHMQTHHGQQRQYSSQQYSQQNQYQQPYQQHQQQAPQPMYQQQQHQPFSSHHAQRYSQRFQQTSPQQHTRALPSHQQHFASPGNFSNLRPANPGFASNPNAGRNSAPLYDSIGMGPDHHQQQPNPAVSQPGPFTSIPGRGGQQTLTPYNLSETPVPASQQQQSRRQNLQASLHMNTSPHQNQSQQPLSQHPQSIPHDSLFLSNSGNEQLGNNGYPMQWTGSDASQSVQQSQPQHHPRNQPDSYHSSLQHLPATHHLQQQQPPHRGFEYQPSQLPQISQQVQYSPMPTPSSTVPTALSGASYASPTSAPHSGPPSTAMPGSGRSGTSGPKPRRSRRSSGSTGPALPVHMRNPKKGRARVFRECTHCHHENHIRRSHCEDCKQQLPAGKRRKDVRHSETSPGLRPSHSALNSSSNVVLGSGPPHHALGQSLAQVQAQAQARAHAQVQGHSLATQQQHQQQHQQQGHQQQHSQPFLPQHLHHNIVDPQAGTSGLGDSTIGSSHTVGTNPGGNHGNVALSPVSGLGPPLGSGLVVSTSSPDHGSTR